MDAFFQVYQGENCNMVPPIVLLFKLLNFMFRSRSRASWLVIFEAFWLVFNFSRAHH